MIACGSSAQIRWRRNRHAGNWFVWRPTPWGRLRRGAPPRSSWRARQCPGGGRRPRHPRPRRFHPCSGIRKWNASGHGSAGKMQIARLHGQLSGWSSLHALLVQHQHPTLIVDGPRSEAAEEALTQQQGALHVPDTGGHVVYLQVANLQHANTEGLGRNCGTVS
jgi:hypothetical protein